jgi:hypothetical protein
MVEINPALCRESGAEPRALASNEAVCLFAFATRASGREMRLPDDAREQRLMLHPVGSVVALTGIVPLTDYCGAEAERKLADIAWLAPRAHQHLTMPQRRCQGCFKRGGPRIVHASRTKTPLSCLPPNREGQREMPPVIRGAPARIILKWLANGHRY